MSLGQCSGCESLPQPIPHVGELLLWPPIGHSVKKLKTSLHDQNVSWHEPSDGCVAVSLSKSLIEAMRDGWTETFGQRELADCKCLVVPPGETVDIRHVGQVVSLETLLGRISGRWLTEMIAGGRLATMFQPIVSVQDPAVVFAHECLLRGVGHDGSLTSPVKLFDAARRGKMLFHLDRAARLRHIRSAIKNDVETNVFINFNPTSIYDPKYCLRSTVTAIGESAFDPSRFVFEVVETDELTDVRRLPEILRYYRDAGFRVALDDVGAGFSSLNLLVELKPDFIKIDMMLIRNIDQDRYKASLVSRLLEVARELGIGTIVEGIETVGEWDWAREHGADFAQGYLFGKPSSRPVPAHVAVAAHVASAVSTEAASLETSSLESSST